MRRPKIHKYQMLARVADFLAKHVALLPKHTAAGDQLAALQSTLAKLSGLATSQVSSDAAIRTSSGTRRAARKALRTLLDLFYQSAQALTLEGFIKPRNKSDQGLIDTGHHFATAAEPFKNQFILQGLFIEKLNEAVQALEAAMLHQAAGRQSRSAAIREFDATLEQGLNYLQLFDVLVSNTMAGNPAVLAGWNVARRLERVARSKPDPEPAPLPEIPSSPPDNPSTTTTAA